MKLATGPIPRWIKSLIMIGSTFVLLPSLLLTFALICFMLIMVASGDRDALGVGLFAFVFSALTGCVAIAFWHSAQSLQNKTSTPLRLPRAWLMAAIFGVCIFIGIFIYQARAVGGLFFPPLLIAVAAIPPLLAVSWFVQSPTEGLSWRRGAVAFAGGATISVAIALFLHLIFSVSVLAFVFAFGRAFSKSLEMLLTDLANGRIAQAITNQFFIYAFVQGAIIAPLVEEIAKPLVTLPLIGRLTRRDAFLVAAMAGAGFAAIENILYATAASSLWAGLIIVRSLSAAIHPLGAGLVGLSWRDILNGERDAWRNGLARFGLAVGMHALWNGGSLLVVALAGPQLVGGRGAPAINILGLSIAGTTLALLIVLGIAALWIGRTVAQSARLPGAIEIEPLNVQFTLSDRAIAIWALVCLVAIVPAGIAVVGLVVR